MATNNRFALAATAKREADRRNGTAPTTTNKYALGVHYNSPVIERNPVPTRRVEPVNPKAPAKAAIVKPTMGPMSATERYKQPIVFSNSEVGVVKPKTGPMSPTERYKQEIPYSSSDRMRQGAVQYATDQLFSFDPGVLHKPDDHLMSLATGGEYQPQKEYDFDASEKRMDELNNILTLLRNDQNIDKQAEYIDTYGEYNKVKGEYEAAKSQKWYEDTGKEISDAIVSGDKGLYSNLKEAVRLLDLDKAEREAMGASGVGNFTTSVQDELNAAMAKLPDNVDPDWLEYARHANERETFDKSMADAREFAEAHPGGASAASVPLNLMSGAGSVDVLGKKLGKLISGSEAPINFQSAAMIPSAATQEIRSTVSEDMSATGSMLYNVGMSIADSAAIIGTSAFGIPGGSALLGSSAATSTMRAASERGATEDQAIVLGLISGAAEAFFEKYSIESLLKPNGAKGAKAFFENFFKQGVTEMTEEGATTLANTAADLFIMGDKSELAYRKQQLIADGYSNDEANRIAGTEWLKNFGVDLLGGLISGGFFSTAKAAGSGVLNAASKPDSRYNEMMRDLDRIMPRLPQAKPAASQTAQEAAVPNAPNTAPTETNVSQGTADDAVSAVLPNVAEHRDTATQILNDGIFDSPTYGNALEQTGMKRSDVRQALRKIAQNTPGADADAEVRAVVNAIVNAEAQPQTAVEPEAVEAAQEAPVAEARQTVEVEQPETAEANSVADEADDMGANPAMGAADYGFDPISNASNKYGAIPPGEKASRIIDVPVSMDGKTKVSHFARTAAEASATSNEMADRIMDLVAKNKVSHEVFSDDAALEAAGEEIAEAYRQGNGYHIYARFLQDVAEGKSGKDLAATGSLLYADAVAAKDHESAAELFISLTELFRRSSQTTQAAQLLKKLTPEGRTWVVRKTVDKINKELSAEGRKGTELSNVPKKEKAAFSDSVAAGREAALEALENLGGAPDAPITGDAAVGEAVAETTKSTKPGSAKKKAERDHGLEVEDWMTEVGKEVAKALDAKPKAQTPKPISRIIRQDILNLAKKHWPQAPKAQTVKRTAADTITDFFANRDKYVEAWNAALEEYRKMHGLGEDFAGPAGAGAEPMMLQAVVDEATAQALKKQKIELFSYLGDQASIEKQLADGLIKRTGATGDDADTIRRAVSQYVRSVLYDANIERIGNGLDRDIRKVVEEIGGSMYEIVRDNKGNKAGAAKIVANMMVKQYGISKDAAQAASAKIVERFNAMIAQKTQKALDAIFADKKKAEPRSAAQKITELGNLGAFESEAYKGKAADKAKQYVDTDIKKAVKAIGKDAAEIIRSSPADKKATAERIKQMLMEKHRLHKADAKRLGDFIIDRFNNYVNENAQKALENYVKPKNKKERKTLQQRFRELANMGAFSGSDYSDLIIQKLFGAPVQIDQKLLDKYAEATDPADIRKIEKEINQSIGRQIPSNFKDKWNAWRHMSMLGTIKSPERNLIGNSAGMIMRVTKNVPASIAEAMSERLGIIDKSERTKAVLPAGKDLKAAAKNDLQNVENELKGIGKHHIVNNEIQEARQIFTPRLAEAVRKAFPELPEGADNVSLEGLRKLIDRAMSDKFFSESTYVDSLSSLLKARGFTAEDFNGNGMTEAQKAEARDYAIAEALKATYRDLNVVSEIVTSLRFNTNVSKTKFGKGAKEALNMGLEGIMPYLKTPANILARGIEYDPVLGTATTIFKAAYAKKHGDFKATELIDDLSKVFTGSMIAVIGYFMRANNLLKASSDDEQDDLEGKQEYSIMIGGQSIPIDWMAPFCMPLFVGVELYELLDKAGDNGAPLTSRIASSFTSLSSAILNTSMLDGLQDTIDNVKYAESVPIALVANMTLGYIGQMFPTFFGQMERALNSPQQEMTFVDKSNKWLDADTQRALGTLSRKIPGWDYNQTPYIDAWGRPTENGGIGKRMFNQILNPANTSEIKETDVDKEIRRLEKDYPGVNLTPSRAESVITVNGEKVILTDDEYTTYAMEKGQGDLAIRSMELSDPDYQNLDGEAQIRAQNFSKDLADNLAKIAAGFDVKDMPDWQKELVGASVEEMAQTCIEHAIESEASSAKYENKHYGLADMLSKQSIDDQLALACMSASANEAYATICKDAGISVQQFLDAYGYASAHGETAPEKKEAVQKYAATLGLDVAQTTALAHGVSTAIGTVITQETNLPKQYLYDIGNIGAIESQLSDAALEKYNVFIKNTVDMQHYIDFHEFLGSEEAKGKKDNEGNAIKGESRMDHAIAWLEKSNYSDEEKGRLFCSEFARDNCPIKWRTGLPKMPKK